MAKLDTICMTLLGIAGLGMVTVGAFFAHRESENTKTVNKFAEKCADAINVDVPEEVVQKAVKKAVDNQVSSAISNCTRSIVNTVYSDIQDGVRAGIRKELDNYHDPIVKEITARVDTLSVDSIKKSIERDVRAKALEKLENEMDSLLKDFDSEMVQVGKVYKSLLARSASSGNNIDKLDLLRILL